MEIAAWFILGAVGGFAVAWPSAFAWTCAIAERSWWKERSNLLRRVEEVEKLARRAASDPASLTADEIRAVAALAFLIEMSKK